MEYKSITRELEGIVTSVSADSFRWCTVQRSESYPPEEIPYLTINIKDCPDHKIPVEMAINPGSNLELVRRAMIGQKVLFTERWTHGIDEKTGRLLDDSNNHSVEKAITILHGNFAGVGYRHIERISKGVKYSHAEGHSIAGYSRD